MLQGAGFGGAAEPSAIASFLPVCRAWRKLAGGVPGSQEGSTTGGHAEVWPKGQRKHTSKPCHKPGRVRGLYLSSLDITASLDFRKGGRKSWTQAFRPGSSSLPTGATEPHEAPGLAWGPDAEAASWLQKDNFFHQGWVHLQEDRSGESQPLPFSPS